MKSHDVGKLGEHIAASALRQKGFRIEAENWRAGRLGEIDLVGYHPAEKVLVFVEVKTRRTDRYGTPSESVTARKQAQLAALAEAYLAGHPHPEANVIRFDVISVHFPSAGKPATVHHLEHAFEAAFQ